MIETTTSPTSRQFEAAKFVGLAKEFRTYVADSTEALAKAMNFTETDKAKSVEHYTDTIRKIKGAIWERPNGIEDSLVWLALGHCMAKVVEIEQSVERGQVVSDLVQTRDYSVISKRSFGTALSAFKSGGHLSPESQAKFGVVLRDGMNIVNAGEQSVSQAERVVNSLWSNIDSTATNSWVIGELVRSNDWTKEANRLAGSAMIELLSDFSRDYEPLEGPRVPIVTGFLEQTGQVGLATEEYEAPFKVMQHSK